MIIIDNDIGIIATRTCVFSTSSPARILQSGQFSVYYKPSKTLYFVIQERLLFRYNLTSFPSGSILQGYATVGASPEFVHVMHVDANFVYCLALNWPYARIIKYNRTSLTYNSEIQLPDYTVPSEFIRHDCCGTGFIITNKRAISVTTGNIETFDGFKAISYNPVLDVCLIEMETNNDFYIVHNFLNGTRRYVKLSLAKDFYYDIELVPSTTQILFKTWRSKLEIDSFFYKHNPLPMNSERGKIKIFAYNEISETTADVVPLER